MFNLTLPLSCKQRKRQKEREVQSELVPLSQPFERIPPSRTCLGMLHYAALPPYPGYALEQATP